LKELEADEARDLTEVVCKAMKIAYKLQGIQTPGFVFLAADGYVRQYASNCDTELALDMIREIANRVESAEARGETEHLDTERN
jgi:uncharacterized linocin/CFP29 family protein